MGINISIASAKAGTTNKILKGAGNSLKVAKLLKKMGSHNSITKMANDAIYQYPVLMSSNTDNDDVITIARALEKQYAASVVASYSLYGTMNENKYEDLGDFTKKFHSNKDILSNFKAAKNAIESIIVVDDKDLTGEAVIESVISEVYTAPELKDVANKCWGFCKEQVNESSLNNIYRPYDRTVRIIKDRLSADNLIATESDKIGGVGDALKRAAGVANRINDKNIGDRNAGVYDESSDMTEEITTTHRSPKSDKSSVDKTTKIVKRTSLKPVQKTSKNEVVRNDRLTALEPTMVNVTITRHGVSSTGSGPTSYLQTLTLGVKAMVRLVRSDLMIANMVEASKNSNAIFRFIKWTKGETKLVRDVILGISEAKRAASANNSIELRVLKSSKKRKKLNNVGKFLSNEVFPTLTIIMTTSEVLQVKNICGVDLSQLYNALTLMNKYYLLAFGIYDTDTKSLQMIFDGDDDFAYTTIGNMRTYENREVNLTNPKDVLKIMGRI